jgi:hypothetical protein
MKLSMRLPSRARGQPARTWTGATTPGPFDVLFASSVARGRSGAFGVEA